MIKMVKYRILQILLSCIQQGITWADIMSLKLETIVTSGTGQSLTTTRFRAPRVNDQRMGTAHVCAIGGMINA